MIVKNTYTRRASSELLSSPRPSGSEKTCRKNGYSRTKLYHFIGADRKVSTKVIGWAHDRTHVLSLKHFATENQSIDSKPMKSFQRQDEDGASTLVDLPWDTPDTIKKFRAAIHNYSAVLYFLWPQDPTGLAMLQLMDNFDYCSGAVNQKLRLHILKTWFNDTLRLNAERAINEDSILSFQDQETLLKSIMQQNGVRPVLPIVQQQSFGNNSSYNSNNSSSGNRNNSSSYGNNQQPRYNQQNKNKRTQQGQQPHQYSQKNNSNNQSRPFAQINGISCCRFFNDESGDTCRNRKTSKGCMIPGNQQGMPDREFLHVCNSFKQSYCFGAHTRKSHR